MSGFVPPGECPVCGCDVPAKAKACPECGACANTGWNEESAYDGLDLPTPENDRDWEEKTQPPKQVQFLPITITIIVLLIFSGIWFLF
jgi:hypothetical protein